MSLKSVCFNDEACFSGNKQNFESWDYSPQVLDYQDFQAIGCQIKEILLFIHCMFVYMHTYTCTHTCTQMLHILLACCQEVVTGNVITEPVFCKQQLN
jgi:hypothetical protein